MPGSGELIGAVDAAGNVVVTGPLGEDRYLAGIDSEGQLGWWVALERPPGDNYATAFALAVASTGEITVAGHFTGTIELGSSSLTRVAPRELFLAHLAP